MPAAHVFNVPQKYNAADAAPAAEPARQKRSKFRWFGHGMRLGKHASAAAAAPASSSSRRSKSGYIATTDDEFSPAPSPRATSKSLTSEADASLDHHTSLLKFGLLRRHHHHNSSDTSSLRSSIASTASTSTTLSDDLSPPSSTASFASTVAPLSPELRSPRMEYETREVLRDVVGVDAVWTDAAHVARHFGRLHWRVVRIEADGNCLFRAVSDQIYRNEAFYGDIRRRVVEYIEREKELFQPFVENEQAGLFEPIDAYCARMKQDAQWGGNPELFAVARLFNVHIVVHQGPLRRLRIENDRTEAPDMEMHLLFRNDHYDSLHDEAQLDAKPRLSASIPDELVEQVIGEDEPRTEDVDNQKEEEELVAVDDATKTKKKKKKKKSVVFIGEQTRVERVEVELPHVVVHAPVRLVVRGGKVCTFGEAQADGDAQVHSPVEEEDNQVSESAPASTTSDDCVVPAPLSSAENPTNDTSNNQDGELSVVRVKRVNFRRGRRVAA